MVQAVSTTEVPLLQPEESSIPPTPVRMVNKKLQFCLRLPQRSRSHQTDTKITSGMQTETTFKSVSTRTEVLIQPCADVADSSDEEDEADDNRDTDYDPMEDHSR